MVWLSLNELTHCGLNKMAANAQATFSATLTWKKNFIFWFEFHWIDVPEGPVDKKASLVQVMAWHPTGIKPSPKPVMTYFYAFLLK